MIRVDIEPARAVFRRVAVREDAQRMGHGRALLSLAEAFARAEDRTVIHSYVDPKAVAFYARCGFAHESLSPPAGARNKTPVLGEAAG